MCSHFPNTFSRGTVQKFRGTPFENPWSRCCCVSGDIVGTTTINGCCKFFLLRFLQLNTTWCFRCSGTWCGSRDFEETLKITALRFLLNVGDHPLSDTTSHPRRQLHLRSWMLSNSSNWHLRQGTHVWKCPKPEVYEHSLIKSKGKFHLKLAMKVQRRVQV